MAFRSLKSLSQNVTAILFVKLSIYSETDLNGVSLDYERISFMAVISTNTGEEPSGRPVSTARLWQKLITPGYAKERVERLLAENGPFEVEIGFLDDLHVMCERDPKRVDLGRLKNVEQRKDWWENEKRLVP